MKLERFVCFSCQRKGGLRRTAWGLKCDFCESTTVQAHRDYSVLPEPATKRRLLEKEMVVRFRLPHLFVIAFGCGFAFAAAFLWSVY